VGAKDWDAGKRAVYEVLRVLPVLFAVPLLVDAPVVAVDTPLPPLAYEDDTPPLPPVAIELAALVLVLFPLLPTELWLALLLTLLLTLLLELVLVPTLLLLLELVLVPTLLLLLELVLVPTLLLLLELLPLFSTSLLTCGLKVLPMTVLVPDLLGVTWPPDIPPARVTVVVKVKVKAINAVVFMVFSEW
jgi:hypothetical protein